MENRAIPGGRCHPLFPAVLGPVVDPSSPDALPIGRQLRGAPGWVLRCAGAPIGSRCSDQRGQLLQACARCTLGRAVQGRVVPQPCGAVFPRPDAVGVARLRSGGRRPAAATPRSARWRSASGSVPAVESGTSRPSADRGHQVRPGRCAGSVLVGRRLWLRSPSPGPRLRCREPGRCGSGSRCSRSPWSDP